MTAELNKTDGREKITQRAPAKRSNAAGTRTASPGNKQGGGTNKSGCHRPLIYWLLSLITETLINGIFTSAFEASLLAKFYRIITNIARSVWRMFGWITRVSTKNTGKSGVLQNLLNLLNVRRVQNYPSIKQTNKYLKSYIWCIIILWVVRWIYLHWNISSFQM